MICADCGSQKTGFTTLFCPKCEAGADNGKSDRLYFISWEEIKSGETVLNELTAFFSSKNDAISALKQSSPCNYHIYSILKCDLFSVGIDILMDGTPIGGVSCQVLRHKIIGIKVKHEISYSF